MRATGRTVELADAPWLRGPCGQPTGVSEADFERYAADEGFSEESAPPEAGLLDDLGALRNERFDPTGLRLEVADFYERTGRYQLRLWSQ